MSVCSDKQLNSHLDYLETLLENPQFIQAGPPVDWAHTLEPYEQYPIVGCRLENYANRWQWLFPKSNAHELLRKGVPLHFKEGPPKLQRTPKVFNTTPDQLILLQQAATEMVQKGVVEVIRDHTSPGLYHRLFMRPKPDGTWRPIIDLSPLNETVENSSFKMETPASIRAALQPGEHVIQLDLKDAYFHIPIRKAYRKYMRFSVGNTVYQYKALPFGLNIAPRVFTCILKPILALLRSSLIRVHAYLDDWIMRLHNKSMGPRTAMVSVKLLRMLGWLINFPKSCLEASLQLTFIGLEWNMQDATVKPRLEKIKALKKDVRKMTVGTSVKIKKVQHIIGVLKWMAPYVPLGYMRLKQLQHLIKRQWSQKYHGWNASILITRPVKERMLWWCRLPNSYQGVPLHTPKPELDIFTDASCHGYGGIMNGQTFSGVWSRRYKQKHINLLELEAVRRGLMEFAPVVENTSIRVHSDNRTTVACLRRQGSLKSVQLNKLTAKLVKWADRHNVTITPVHIQGYRNVEADALSRRDTTHASEWSLSQKEFNRIVTWSGLQPPWMDLMATHANRQTESFISPYPHPDAAGVDALSLNWNFPGTLWIYPPTGIIPKVIEKIRQTQNVTLIIIAPHTPLKPWYPDLMSLTTKRSTAVGRSVGSVIQHVPHQEDPVQMEDPSLLRLRAWIVHK